MAVYIRSIIKDLSITYQVLNKTAVSNGELNIGLILIFVISALILPSTFADHSEVTSSQTEEKTDADPVNISVFTDKSRYNEGDRMVIRGKTSNIPSDTHGIIQIFSQGNLVEIFQTKVIKDGSYSGGSLAAGSLWDRSGQYTVRVSFGEDSAETQFIFSATAKTDPVFIKTISGSSSPGCEETRRVFHSKRGNYKCRQESDISQHGYCCTCFHSRFPS